MKTVELSNWVGKAIIIPRSKLKDAKERQETKQPAIYFLFWEDEDWNKKAYIWEAENLINRLGSHDWAKDFRDTVIAFISKDNNLTKADVKYLESKSIQKAIKSNRFQIQNSAEPVPNNLPEYQVGAMDEFLNNIDLLMSALWYPILKDLPVVNKISDKIIYVLKLQGCDAKWIYTEEGFLILKWSVGRYKETESFWWKAKNTKEELIEQKKVLIQGEQMIFQEDYLSSAPSHASSLLAGRSSNGRTDWKDEQWKTLDEVERKYLKS